MRVGEFGRPYADVVRDLDVIDSELRLLAAVRRTTLEDSGTGPRIDIIDGLLDERRAVVTGDGD